MVGILLDEVKGSEVCDVVMVAKGQESAKLCCGG